MACCLLPELRLRALLDLIQERAEVWHVIWLVSPLVTCWADPAVQAPRPLDLLPPAVGFQGIQLGVEQEPATL
eukprot:495059-Pyramimonas_sp.AAC.1